MKLKINLKNVYLSIFGILLILLLYCFASNGRYERVESAYGGSVYTRAYVYLDTWRGRLCCFDADGNREYIREE